MEVLAIVHQADAGPGVFAQAVRDSGARLHAWKLPHDGPPSIDPRHFDAVMTFGGAMHPDQEQEHPWLAEEKALLADLLERRVPVLGVCLGAQLLAEAAGAPARRARRPEIGWYEVGLTDDGSHDPLLGPLWPRFQAFEWHSYEFPLPRAAAALAHSDGALQAYRLGGAAWGIQFHAEVTLPDVEAWIEDYRSDEDAVRLGLEPGELLARTRAEIDDWNELGRALCGRFLAVASTRASGRRRSVLRRP
jgi:GMP synthase (glutamine-hydrolysing)